MKKDIDYCIYCGKRSDLSDEHIIPYGLGGDMVLGKASCDVCAKITCRLEGKLLRGHWWPYRLFLGHKSRRRNEDIPNMIIKIIHENHEVSEVPLAMKSQSAAFIFELDKPTKLDGIVRIEEPYAPRVYMKLLSPLPSVFGLNGKLYPLKQTDKIEIPINFNAEDLVRFLAKIAHGYSYLIYGDILGEYYLPKIILGKTDDAMTYVGGIPERYTLSGKEIHAVMSKIENDFLIVYIQLFRDGGEPPPIYKVVVGKIKKSI